MLNPTIRAALRKSANRWLKDRCDISVDSVTIGDDGGQTRVSVGVAANVPCRKIRASQTDMMSAGLIGSQETMRDTYKLVVSPGIVTFATDQKVTFEGDTFSYDVAGLITELTDEFVESAIVTRRR